MLLLLLLVVPASETVLNIILYILIFSLHFTASVGRWPVPDLPDRRRNKQQLFEAQFRVLLRRQLAEGGRRRQRIRIRHESIKGPADGRGQGIQDEGERAAQKVNWGTKTEVSSYFLKLFLKKIVLMVTLTSITVTVTFPDASPRLR